MARIKKTSKTVETARIRLAGLKSIDPNLDLGNGVTVAIYESKIDKAGGSLETYNTTLSVADEHQDIFENDEADLKDYHERILLGVGSKFGKDSIEYEKAGGTRKSERRKPAKAGNQLPKNTNPPNS
jgi:hypothetical protein